MKTLLSLALGSALTIGALGIPQNFNGGGNGFFGAIGINFEDFAGQAAAFDPGAKMPGKWAPVRGQKNTVKLELDAVVFGIKASEITASKSDDKVLQFRVAYRVADHRKDKGEPGTLEARVMAAVNAYTGKSVTLGHPVDYKGVQISVGLGGNGDVFVTFSRAS
jgi:hypothetical protein